MIAAPWRVRWERGPEGPYRVGTADPAGERPPRANSAADPVTVLMLPGRGDSLELRAEVAARLIRPGVRVVMVEHVGQGASRGLGAHPDAAHVDDFHTHVAAALAQADSIDGPAVLLAHSMGGLVAAHVLALRPDRFAAAVITSPMWGFSGLLPLPVTRLLADLAGRAGKAGELAAGERPFGVESCLRMRGAADDQAPALREHARRHPDLVRGGSTWGWVRAAASAMQQLRRLPLDTVRGEVTVVSCQDDTTVSLAAHREVARRFARGRLLEVSAGHDPFVADRDARRALWQEIDRALAPYVGRGGPAVPRVPTR